jgi:hypothetical protein
VNNLDSTAPEQLAFAVHGSHTGAQQELSLWSTNESAWFVQLPPPKLDAAGRFELEIQPETVYTVSTLAGAAKAARKGDHAHSELAAPFPLPHSDNFSGYADGRSPRFFTDWDGSFSIVGGVLKQQVLHPPIRWHCTDVDPITLVAPGYSNYDVSAAARIDSSAANASGVEAYVSVCARQQKPFDGWCPSASGYCLRLAHGGAWSLTAGKTAIAHGTATAVDGSLLDASRWQTLRLRVYGTSIQASLNDDRLAQLNDTSFDNGPAALGSGYHYASFSAFHMRALGSSRPPAGSTAAAYPVFTGTALATPSNHKPGEYGMAFTALRDITITALARFAAAGPTGSHRLSLHCAARNGTQKDPRCRRPPRVAEALGGCTIDMNLPDRDATGLVWAPIRASTGAGHAAEAEVRVAAGQQYYLVSEELGAKSDDSFYTTTQNYPCIGAPGPGGTLPKLDVQVDSVRIDGGVYRLTDGTASGTGHEARQPWQPVLWDYRPRSYGPLSFAVLAE